MTENFCKVTQHENDVLYTKHQKCPFIFDLFFLCYRNMFSKLYTFLPFCLSFVFGMSNRFTDLCCILELYVHRCMFLDTPSVVGQVIGLMCLDRLTI